jgi:5-methylcytosine-specific restriction endonuclease McrA
MSMENTKVCDTCAETKPLSAFPLFKNRSAGVRPTCRVCTRKASTQRYYERNKEACMTRTNAWRAVNREQVLAARRVWRKANPEKGREESRKRFATMSAEERERRRLASARYYAENREAELEKQRTKRAQNPEKNRALARAWSEAHPERAAERTRKWRKENPDTLRLMRRIYRQTRRARNVAAGAPDPEHIERLLRETHCIYCQKAFDPTVRSLWLTIDHVVPLVLGGTNASENLFAACNGCNRSKGGRLLSDWKKNPRPGWTPVRGVDRVLSSEGEAPTTSEREQQSSKAAP